MFRAPNRLARSQWLPIDVVSRHSNDHRRLLWYYPPSRRRFTVDAGQPIRRRQDLPAGWLGNIEGSR
jgi:hypothetical protein